MNELVFIITIAVLGLVIVGLIFAIFHIIDQHNQKENKMLEEQSRLVKAIIAKNANDYVMTTSIDKIAPEVREKKDDDFIDPDNLSDDEFDASLGIIRKPPKK